MISPEHTMVANIQMNKEGQVNIGLAYLAMGFEQDIRKMNAMYELEPITPQMVETRLKQFEKILTDECSEIDEIQQGLDLGTYEQPPEGMVDIRVALADLLGDICVYCFSEAMRWNIPLEEVLQLIMASNFSKLGADGKPIKDPETGKFLKGPNYWKPEPKIKELFDTISKMEATMKAQSLVQGMQVNVADAGAANE